MIEETFTQEDFKSPGENQLYDRWGNPRQGRYMHTAGGEKYFPFDPRAEDVTIETIAHHLATQSRWNGATQHRTIKERITLAVSEHSVLVSRFIEEELDRPDLALEGLLHDAPEGYIGDLIRPLKYDPSFRQPFLRVEVLQDYVIAKRFGLIYPFPKEIKIADEAVCEAESQQVVVKSSGENWSSDTPRGKSHVAPYEIQMLPPFEAKMQFLARFHELYDIEKDCRR